MLFTEFRFLVFFVAVFALYWALRSNHWRKIWLLLASYFFYGCWDWRFLSLIMLSTLIDFTLGWSLAGEASARRKKVLIVVSLVVNLGILGVFKYYNFFADSFLRFASLLGVTVHPVLLHVVLPVGVSFYTFQSLSYTIDIYRSQIQPSKSFLDFALAVAFFPHLEAGPIMRARIYLDQLATKRRLGDVDFRWALTLFGIGFIKKACISDNISPYVDAYFRHPSAFGPVDAWLAVTLYAMQIYCDFSGYTDMGIACAGMLGYRMCPNFDAPYLAASITDFWRRWHMSLSTWLRDYLYFSLGGNRKGRIAAHRNLMITMLLGGLWHGASWNFVIWGGLHGMALIVHKEWLRLRKGVRSGGFQTFFSWAFTLAFVVVAWVPFRASTLRSTLTVFATMAGLGHPHHDSVVNAEGALALAAVAVALLGLQHVSRRSTWAEWWRAGPTWTFAAGYGVAAALVLAIKPVGTVPFIYFQF